MLDPHSIGEKKALGPCQEPFLGLLCDHQAAFFVPFDEPNVESVDARPMSVPRQSFIGDLLFHGRFQLDPERPPFETSAKTKIGRVALQEADIGGIMVPRRPFLGPHQPSPDVLWLGLDLQFVMDMYRTVRRVVVGWPYDLSRCWHVNNMREERS